MSELGQRLFGLGPLRLLCFDCNTEHGEKSWY